MKLTTKGRFAVTAVLDLALHQAGGPVTLAQISKRQKISLSYLEQLFSKLRRKKIVSSIRGPGGGYQLAQMASEITVADIIFAVDEPVDATSCSGKSNCNGFGKKCLTHDLWNSLTATIVDHMKSVTLAHLMESHGVSAPSTVPETANKPTVVLRKEQRPFDLPNSVFAWANR